MSDQNQRADNPVVDLQDVRAHLQSRSRKASPEVMTRELEAIRDLLDQGLTIEARSRLTSLLTQARNYPALLAEARCCLSMALEMQGHDRESLEAVVMYEDPVARAKLDPDLVLQLRIRISLAYNYTGDHPKAIALLNAALRDLPEDGSDMQAGAIYAALARVYRAINEYPIARDYSQRALERYRMTGDWRGLAESYFGLATAEMQEGQYEAALENYGQAIQLTGDHPATFLLGKIYSNMAGACRNVFRPHEGIRYLEKAISYYERTDHKRSASDAYNNLAINLIVIGEWDRAEEALERSLGLANEVDERGSTVTMILDSLGELSMLRGDLNSAKDYLKRAQASEKGNKWYAGQALRTLARCLILTNETEEAQQAASRALALAEQIGDRQGIYQSHLLLGEISIERAELDQCADHLQSATEQISNATADLPGAGEVQRLSGLLALARSDTATATQHFSRSLSIFDLLGDRCRGARAHYELGKACAITQPDRAAEHLSLAINAFRELGARLDLARAEEAAAAIDKTPPQELRQREALVQLLTLRLAEAVASRELLLRELAAVVSQETNARVVMITEKGEDERPRVVIVHGSSREDAERWAHELAKTQNASEQKVFADKYDVRIINLNSSSAPPATLLIAPRERAKLPGELSLDPLLRVVELGMDVCALRARTHTASDAAQDSVLAGSSLMPGFIHSSPAMSRLVEEVHKIRSSDVTVLVTGESGTGKELVARAIHALSSRREKVFVPFNCTAVPKELSEGYLFGYRRGAFTGAVKDSAGVIRTAAGGTLFLDEIGDLPLDVQPKLLRFLQEGEIQPLGEQRPAKVDVRIIAATNTDLEEMVAQGRFREDLYYRLNVIRLRVPPLRERRSEIPTIVNYYVNHYSAKFGRREVQITPQAIDLLMVADWPGNVRQLCNEVQRVIARAEDGAVITPEQLSPELRHMGNPMTPPGSVTPIGAGGPSVTVPLQNVTLADALAEVERRMIAEALRKHNGNISRAARELGLTRRGLYLKLERHAMSASA